MGQDLLTRLHRSSRQLAAGLGPLRPLARTVYRRLLRARYASGGLMRARQNGREWKLAPEVALRGELQEYGTFEWLRSVVKPGMVVIDVGANVGQVSMECAELVGAGGRVLAVEPGEGNLRLLRRHLEANGYAGRVEIVEGVCADTDGEVTFFIAGESADAVGSGHTLAGEEAVRRQGSDLPVHEVRARAYTVDTLCKVRNLRADVVKIDVEGAELSVLRGMREVLRDARPIVWVGFHPFAFDDAVAASDELREVFAAAGYRFEGPSTGALGLEEYAARPAEK